MIRQHLTMQINGIDNKHCFGYECKQFETLEEGTKELGVVEHLRLLNYAYRLIQASAARSKHYKLHAGPNAAPYVEKLQPRKRGRPRKTIDGDI